MRVILNDSCFPLRRVFAIFLLVNLVCQSFATAGQVFVREHANHLQQEAEALEHDLMHWEGVPHHHDEHGAVLQDDSDASFQHLLGDGGVHNAVPWQLPVLVLAALGSTPPPTLTERGPPQPHLDGPRRPPRLPI